MSELSSTTAPLLTTDLPAGSFLEILAPFLLMPLISAGVTMVLVPICSRLAFQFGIVDRPDARKRHGRVVPYMGGLAMVIGWLVALWVHEYNYKTALGALVVISLSALAICAVGLYDDKYKIRAWTKLVAQLVIGVGLFAAGIGQGLAGELLAGIAGTAVDLNRVVDLAVSLLLVLFLIAGSCNAANLIDGLDGLCSGVTSIIAVGLAVIAIQACQWSGRVEDMDVLRISLAMALLGSTLGFLGYNSPPARIFMGDAGSLFIGLSIGVLAILLADINAKCLLGALMCFGLPVADSALAIYRRWRQGRSIFSADNWHLHHLLIRRGLTVQQAIWVMYLLSITFTLTGVTVILMQFRHAFVVIASFAVNFLVMAVLLGLGGERKPTGELNVDSRIDDLKGVPQPADQIPAAAAAQDSTAVLTGIVPSDQLGGPGGPGTTTRDSVPVD